MGWLKKNSLRWPASTGTIYIKKCRIVDPDSLNPDPGFWRSKTEEEKNTAEIFVSFFWSKIAIYLCPIYRRSVHSQRKKHPALQKMKFINFFSMFVGHFCLLGSGLRLRIRIGIHSQGFGSVSVSGSASICVAGSRSGSAFKLRIRIRIQEGKNDLQNRKKSRIFMFLSTGCSLLRAEGFSCSLGVLYGGLGIKKLQILIKKLEIKFPAINFSQF